MNSFSVVLQNLLTLGILAFVFYLIYLAIKKEKFEGLSGLSTILKGGKK